MNTTLIPETIKDKRALLSSLLKRNAAEKTTPSPLSIGQKALWFLYQSAKESAAYNVGFSIRIRSELNVTALKRALQGLIDRHSSLRSRFKWENGELAQLIAGHQNVAFELVDLGDCDLEELNRHVVAAYRRPFDLETGPVFRAHLFRRSVRDSVLLITVSHIVYDGWSLWLNLDELGQLYQSEITGTKPTLPRLRASYQDYVRKQEEMLAGPKGEQLWNYWKEQLSGDIATLNLPTDYTRPPVQTFRGASHKFELPAQLAEQYKTLAKAEGVTLFTLLLAAFQVLLHRYSGQEDILVGTPTAGLRTGEFADVVGYFVNPVVVRGDLSGNPTFKDFLAKMHQRVLGAIEHQDLPFPSLVERLKPRRDASHSPLFQVFFVFQRSQRSGGLLDLTVPAEQSTPRVRWGGLDVENFDLAQQEGQFDLELELANIDEAIFGSFKYNTDLFGAASVARLADSFSALLHSIIQNPEQKVGELAILSPETRLAILAASGSSSVEAEKLECLHATFERRVKETPDAIALVDRDRRLTYQELNEKADCLAKYLQSLGVKPDSLVGICVERSWEMLVGILGILKAGGAYVPLDPSSPLDRRSFIVEDSAVSILLTQKSLAEDLKQVRAKVVCLDQDWPTIAAVGETIGMLQKAVSIDHLAYVIYTSGTTGRPKGVQITHRNVARLFTATKHWYNFSPTDVWPLFHSFAFDVSVWEIWGAFLHGGRLVVVPYLTSRSPAEFRDLLVDEGVTVLNQTPSAFRFFMQADATASRPLALRLVIFAGEALDIQSLKPWFDRYGDEVPQMINKYGITETTVHSTYRLVTKEDLKSTKSMVGVPIPDLQIYILDPYLQPVPVGVVGEIYVGGEGLARGYLNRPELDAARFIQNPFHPEPGSRLYKSGDLARYLADGDIEYLGRSDNQVKIRGFRVELGEIETVLGSHSQVAAAIVRVQKTQVSGDRLVAYIVSRNQITGLVGSLRAHLAERLPDYMIPAVFVTIEKLPLTGNGKIDYRALPVPENTRNEAEQSLVPPRDPVEQKLAALWERVLDIRPIGVRDNFFTLGGDSLLAVYLMAEIEREFGKNLPLAALFRNPSIEKLGQSLREDAYDAPWSPLVPIRTTGTGTPLFCVAGGGGNVLYFYQLAQRLPHDRPFYGLQAIGLDGRREPLTRVEDIAAEYIKDVRRVQPRGPYLLGGHCFGCWIAFEMAQQLRRAGDEVALVVVIDSPAPYPKAESSSHETADEAAWLAKFGAILSESAGKDLGIDYRQLCCLGADAQLVYFKDRMEAAGLLPPATPVEQVRGFFRVFVQNSKTSYLPQSVQPVPIAIFRAGDFHSDYDYSAADDTDGADNQSTLGWGNYALNRPSVAIVPGNHITMMSEPNVSELAAQIAQRLASL